MTCQFQCPSSFVPQGCCQPTGQALITNGPRPTVLFRASQLNSPSPSSTRQRRSRRSSTSADSGVRVSHTQNPRRCVLRGPRKSSPELGPVVFSPEKWSTSPAVSLASQRPFKARSRAGASLDAGRGHPFPGAAKAGVPEEPTPAPSYVGRGPAAWEPGAPCL